MGLVTNKELCQVIWGIIIEREREREHSTLAMQVEFQVRSSLKYRSILESFAHITYASPSGC